MSFVRVKKIKGNRYAYLVENTWQGRGSRQHVKAYLGKVLTPEASSSVSAPDISDKNFEDSVITLAAWTLTNHGFANGNGLHVREEVNVDLGAKSVKRKTKAAVLELNEGFMCSHTLKQLLDFQGEGSHEEEVGQRLAGQLLEAGISVSHETFVELFKKIYKPLQEA